MESQCKLARRDVLGGTRTRWLGNTKGQSIITSETISLLSQCMCLNDDLRQVTIQDMSQAITHLACSTIEEVQAELQWNGEDWK